MKTVSTKLGLSPDASEEAVLAAVTKLMNRSTELETENGTLKTQNAELGEIQIEAALDKYKNRFKPEKRDAWKNRLKADRKGSLELLEEMEPITTEAKAASGTKLLNRKDTGTPGASHGAAPASETTQLAAVNEFKFKNRCTFEEAWNAVRAEKPELFENQEEK